MICFIVLYGRKIKDHKKYGWLTFREVIENSSNVGAIKLVKRLGNRRFYDYIQRFGFGEKTNIEFPGEVKGIVRSPENWSGLSLASISIGQEISITPIQMITAFSALVNGGRIMKPLVLKKVCDSRGNLIEERHPVLAREVISKKTSERMKNIMRGVVERGTGQKADIPGYWIGGKTGTAQIINKETGEYSHEDFLASFIGFFPDADARWAMLVMVDRPKTGSWGGEVAAPIFREVAEKVIQYYHVPPRYEDNPSGKGNLPRAAQLSKKSSLVN
jgi:cell division protein FtsI (penicillin-binding protein 3)